MTRNVDKSIDLIQRNLGKAINCLKNIDSEMSKYPHAFKESANEIKSIIDDMEETITTWDEFRVELKRSIKKAVSV